MKKYIELKNELKKFIDANEPDTQLPSHHEIINTYGVSITTVRKALDELISERLIYSHHGKGNFVSPNKNYYKKVYCVFNRMLAKNELFTTLMECLSRYLMEENMCMLLSLYLENPVLEKQILERVSEENPFGAIYVYSGFEKNIEYYKKAVDLVPNSVFVDRHIEGLGSYVGSDNYMCFKNMTDEIKEEKFDMVYFIEKDIFSSTTISERKKGFFDSICQSVNKDNVLVYQNIAGNNSYNVYLMEKFKEDIRNHKRICVATLNSEEFFDFYSEDMEYMNSMEKIKVLTFDKPNFEINNNISYTYAQQNIQLIGKKIVEVIKNNKKTNEKWTIKSNICHIN